MSIREMIEKNKRWLAPSVLVLGVAATALSIWNSHRTSALPDSITRAYYTVDGKSYFADDLNKPYPFDHGGQQAYRAYVFSCNGGKPFVGLIGRQANWAAAKDGSGAGSSANTGAIEVRKPGEEKWLPFNSREVQHVIDSLCPGGRPEAVLPD